MFMEIFGESVHMMKSTGDSQVLQKKLQILQNKVLRLQTGLSYDYPTKDLIEKTEQLSVHQLIAYHTLIQVHKVIIDEKPKYLSDKMKIKVPTQDSTFPHRQADKHSH